jgi:ABC-type Fe3+ transport system permease subunit
MSCEQLLLLLLMVSLIVLLLFFSWLRENGERENGRAARGTPLSPFVHLTRLLLIVCATRFSLFFLSRYVVPFAVR